MTFINEMAPNTSSSSEIHAEENFGEGKEEFSITTNDENVIQNQDDTRIKSEGLFKFKTEVKWLNAISIIFLYISTLYACFIFEWCRDLRTNIWSEYSLEDCKFY